MKKLISSILVLTALISCDEESFIPKPPTYLRLELPDHKYRTYEDDCPYILAVPELFKVKQVSDANGMTCHKDIESLSEDFDSFLDHRSPPSKW